MFQKLKVIILILGFGLSMRSAHAQTPSRSITEENIQIGYILNGYCSDMSSDSMYIAVRGSGVFNLASGQQKFSFVDDRNLYAAFSPDSRYAMVERQGIYRVETGELVHEIESYGIFSNNGRYIAVFIDFDQPGYLYDLDEGRVVIDAFEFASGLSVEFSPNSRYLAAGGDAVYDVTTGEVYFELDAWRGLFGFSPDGAYLSAGATLYNMGIGKPVFSAPVIGWDFHPTEPLVIGRTGVFTFSGEHVLETSTHGYFSPDGRYAAFDNDGVYEVGTWQQLFTVEGTILEFNIDGSLLLTDLYPNGTRWYEVLTGQYHTLEIPGPTFSEDGKLIVDRYCTTCAALDPFTGDLHYEASGYGRFSKNRQYMFSNDNFEVGVYERSYCRIYSAASEEWPNKTGLVRASNINLREGPGSEYRIIGSGSGNWLVAARNSTEDWYLVRMDNGIYGWVSASVVEIISMSDQLPTI